ncbi:MAG: hypothetical protein OHK0037_13530 [Elainellaceae cyanobacterium]
MTEADLVLAKVFLLFSVAGYTITAANTNPQPRDVSQVVMGWAAAVTTGMTGDRSDWADSSVSSFILPSGDQSAPLPLALGQRSPLFSDRVSALSVPNISPAVVQEAEPITPKPSSSPSRSSLTLPPVLAEAGFQFQL